MMPKVDTFEHNIVEEIKRKDASLTDISSASNNIGNNEEPLPEKKPIFLIVVICLFVLFLIGVGGLAYYYFNDPLLNPKPQPITQIIPEKPKPTEDIAKLSPTIATNIGRFIIKTEKKERGYVLTISDYSSVFGYLTRHENDYIEELALLYSQPEKGVIYNEVESLPLVTPVNAPIEDIQTSSVIASSTQATSTKKLPVKKPVKSKTTIQLKATTTLATSTIAIAITSSSSTPKSLSGTSTLSILSSTTTPTVSTSTTTPTTTTSTQKVSSFPRYTDVTMSNQNMRVWTSGKRKLVYAFVGNNTVIISDSPEGILATKGAILH